MHKVASLPVVYLVTVVALAAPAGYAWLNPTDPGVVTVKDTADNEFSFYGGPAQQTEWLNKNGTQSSARLKGAETIGGFKFDLSSYKGKTVTEAELHLARSNTDQIFSMVAATINTDWVEGTACWRYRDTSKEWTFPYSDFSTATFGNYGSLVCFGYAADNTFRAYTASGFPSSWIAMKLNPDVVQALILDQPGGLAVTDPRGHLYTNPAVYTREGGTNGQPRLYIKFGTTNDTTPPGAVASLGATAGPEDGQAILSFAAPTDSQAAKAFGYTIRYGTPSVFASAKDVDRWRIARPSVPGTSQKVLIEGLTPGTTYTFYVQAYDAAGNGGTVQTTTLKVPAAFATATLANGSISSPNPIGKSVRTVTGVLRYWATSEVAKVNPVTGNRFEDGYTSSGSDNYKKANVVWDAGTNTLSLIGCRNEVIGAQLILEKLGASLTGAKVVVGDLAGPGGAKITASPNVELFQLHYVSASGVYYADAAIPLKAPFPDTFGIPDANHNPTGKNQSVWMDFYLPKTATAGDYTGTITVTATQLTSPVTINLKVHVSSIVIPDFPTFVVDLNGYGAPWDFGTGNNIDLTCLRYFQTAHQHRAVCNILPYGWNGSTHSDRRPDLSGTGSSLHASDWTAFDARYGRFFDGTAFLPTTPVSPYAGPGQGTPITHFYTTFHEMWPISLLDTTYGFDAAGKGGTYWDNLVDTNPASFFATAPDIYPAFTTGYKQANRNVVTDWVTHAHSKGWTYTAFECYLNNKYYYNGSHALWELEECTTADDFRAVGFFHQLYRDGLSAAGISNVPWHNRIDISDRWGQNWGQLDNRVNWQDMGSGAAGWHWPNKEYRKYVLDGDKQEEWIWYGLGAPIAASGIGNAQVFLQKWCQSFKGGLPYWDNYQTSWSTANDLSTMYSGQSVPGLGVYEGAIMSTRVKMIRQVEQTIELLNLWANTTGMNRQRVRDALSAKYGDKTRDFSFNQLDELKLYQIHADLIAQLDPTAPRPPELQVTPTSDLVSTGPKGGPFTPTSATYTLTNIGAASLNWTAGKGQSWVTLSKSGGTLAAGATDTVTVTIGTNATSLNVGTYTDTISFTNTTNHTGDAARGASLTIQGTGSQGALQVTPATGLSSSGSKGGPFTPASTTYTLTNTGTATITWTAGKTQAWVTLSKTSGALTAGATDTVMVSIGTGANNLNVGSHTDAVTFTNSTNGSGNTTRAVSLAVNQPPTGGLTVTPATGLTAVGPQAGPFSGATVTYTLTNTSSSSLSWTAGKTQAWLTLSKAGGALAAGATDTVVASIDASAATALAPATYTDTVTFTNATSGNGNTTRPASLTIRLPLPATLSVLPTGSLGSSGIVGGPFVPASITYTLTNTGDAPLTWTAGKTQPWLTLSNAGGTLAAGATDTVVVALDAAATAALAAGKYTDTLTFTNTTNNTGDTTRPVSLSIRLPVPGTLRVSPVNNLNSTGVLGGPFLSNQVTYTLTNAGDEPLTWTAGKTAAWLALSSNGGSLTAGADSSVVVSINGIVAVALAAQTYTDTVTFTNTTNGNGDATRIATLIISMPPPGSLAVSAGGLTGSGPLGGPFASISKTYTLTNSGGQTVSWSVGTTQPWITLSRTSGTLNPGAMQTISVSINSNVNALDAGLHTDTVTFTNATNHTGDTTRTVSLTVTVPLPTGQLTVSPAGGLGSSGDRGGPFLPAGITYTLSNPGGSPIDWSAGKSQNWLSLSKTSGTLGAGSTDSVTVSIGSSAASLARGTYNDTVTFSIRNSSGTVTRTASLSIVLIGDVDNDGVVSILDVLRLVQAYGTSTSEAGFDATCDFNHDGEIDLADLVMMAGNFGKTN